VLELYDVTQPGRFVVLSQWDDRADHDAMGRTMGFSGQTTGIGGSKKSANPRHDVEDPEQELAL
jgi:heme-degrading monooxygenase HmoA